MTPESFFTDLKSYLSGLEWSAGVKLFGDSVYVVPNTPIEQIASFMSPSAFVIDAGFAPDEAHPNIGTQNFNLQVFVENIQSAHGEGAMLGANRTAATSLGAGVIQIQQKLLKSLTGLISLSGTKIMVVERSLPAPVFVRANLPLVFRMLAGRVLLEAF